MYMGRSVAVLDHAGLDVGAFPFHRCPPVLSNRNGHHLAAASTGELDEVSRIQQNVLSQHGYPAR